MTGTLVASHETKSEQDYALARLPGTRFTTPAEPGRRFRGVRVVPDPLLAITLLRNSVHAYLRRLEVIEYQDEVILTGVVRSYYLKQLAQETVRPTVTGRRLHNKVVVSPTTAAEPRSAAPLRIVIATGNADLSSGCAERLQAVGHVVECIGSGLALLATLRSGLPDVLVVADLLPWGGGRRRHRADRRVRPIPAGEVIHAGLPDALTRLPPEFRDQLAAVIVGDDCTADMVVLAVERVLTG